MSTLLSIIIPVYNEEFHIKLLLDSLWRQNIRKGIYEIIIVDNGSTDETIDIVSRYAMLRPLMNIRLVHEQKKHVCAARNRGARASKGSVLVFLDADNVMHIDFLSDIYRSYLEGYRLGTICTLASEESRIGHIVFLILELIKICIGRPFGKNYCSKEIYQHIGGYNENISLGTNVDFLVRAKRYATSHGWKMKHLQKPIYTSLRRFEKYGYVPILLRWIVAYVGYRKIKYQKRSSALRNYALYRII